MKEKLTNNSGLKLLSLLCAFVVWLAVVNIANPIKVDTQEVTVEFTNKEVLERANLTYEIVGKKTAVVSYKVKTKDAYKVKASDFRAYADLSEMYDVTGAIPIKVEVLKNEELLESVPTVRSPEVIKIKTEAMQKKPFEVQVNATGTPTDGYVAGAVTLIPETVYVEGPTSLVGQINSVGIEFSVDNAVSDVAGTAPVMFYDANGNRLTELGDAVTVLGGDVAYSMQILKVKNLPLDFVVVGEVREGYKYTGVEASVQSVPVAGLKSALASLSGITVQTPELSVEGATSDKTIQIDLASYIAQGVQIAGMEETTVTVTLRVEQLQERTYSVEAKDIVLNGKSDNYTYGISTDKLDVKIRGLKEDLDSLAVGKLSISIDVSGMNLGVHTVRPKISLDAAYEIRELPMCQVEVVENADPAVTQKVEAEKPTEITEDSVE